MTRPNHMRSEDQVSKTDRKLGLCKKQDGENHQYPLGQRMEMRRRSFFCNLPVNDRRTKAFEK
jgi:hypothetical protein